LATIYNPAGERRTSSTPRNVKLTAIEIAQLFYFILFKKILFSFLSGLFMIYLSDQFLFTRTSAAFGKMKPTEIELAQ